MQVKLKIHRVANRHRQRRGAIVDLPGPEAAELIRTGRAVAVQAVPVPPPLKPKRKKDSDA